MRFIMLTVLLDMVAIGLIIPVLPALVGSFTSNQTEQAEAYRLVTLAFGAANFVCSPLLGALSDRFGRRPVLLIGMTGLAISFFTTALATALWMLIAVRVLSGAMQANAAVANAYAADVSSPEDRAKNFGLLGAMFGLGFMLGPVLGGLLGAIDIHLPFFVAGSLAIINGLYGYFVLPESLPADKRSTFNWAKASPLSAFKALNALEGLGPLVAILALSGLAQFTLHTTWVLYTQMKFGWGPLENGQLTCVFVDHGLLRLNEGDMVMDMFAGRLHAKVIRVDASELFLGALAGVTDPEKKRKIIGGLFVDVFKAEADKLKAGTGGHKGATFLAQGTIYPDVVESGGTKTKKATTIKSHHNVGGLPEQLGLKLLEPLRELFKDEVRELGVALGLPADMVYRHPFPGPGLGVRILGDIKPEYVKLLQRADAIFIEELRAAKDATGKSWYDLTSQAFTVFLPVKSVGVMGDGRTYDYVVALRAVQTSDFMTADWAELPYSLLKKVSGRIINEVRGINRVTYDIGADHRPTFAERRGRRLEARRAPTPDRCTGRATVRLVEPRPRRRSFDCRARPLGAPALGGGAAARSPA
ncbi:MAG: hypothetical protein C4K60_18925 [Ideonella sp. MAG2]|nr:MAG: hypothetical protein C4K60_18925 [Ideonella sp. MAG2]